MQSDRNLYADEVTRFERLADEWWDPAGRFKPLHALAPARLGYLRRAIDTHFGTDPKSIRPLAGRSALDVGCGGGLVAEPLARLGADVTGIDPGADNIRIAEIHAARSRLAIRYRQAMAEDMIAEGRTFDLVTCLEVIEHVPDPDAFVATVARLVAPGGCLVMSTLNKTAKSYALAIVGAEYVLGWLERGTHDWNRFVPPENLANMLEAAGLAPFSDCGIVFDAMAGTWKASDDLDVNYMMAARHLRR